MDLGLEQNEVAIVIGVTESSIWIWGNGMKPGRRYMKRFEVSRIAQNNSELKTSVYGQALFSS